MNKILKSKKGITLVALVITIIILLILAGITISQLSGSGLFENAKLAEQKSKDTQEKEEGILADYANKINGYVDGSRETNGIKMCSPIKLFETNLESSGSIGRPIGEYKASSSLYVKNSEEVSNEYFEFQENIGWKVLKEGFYLISAQSYGIINADPMASIRTELLINNTAIGKGLTGGLSASGQNAQNMSWENNTVYLSKNDIIDFKCVITGNELYYNYAYFMVYAMFK